jgi:hypothetical protein
LKPHQLGNRLLSSEMAWEGELKKLPSCIML